MDVPKISAVMEQRTHALPADGNVYEAAKTLIDAGVTGAPVVDSEGKVVGLLTEAECLQLLTHREQVPTVVEQIMRTDFLSASPDMDVTYVAGMFNAHPEHRRCIVVEDGRLQGVITRKDILKTIHALTA